MSPRPGHQLDRYAHDGLTIGDQIGFQSGADLAAVLNRPAHFDTVGRACPHQGLKVPIRGCSHGFFADFAANFVYRTHGVGFFVCIDANNHHERLLYYARQCLPRREPARPRRHCRDDTLPSESRIVCAWSRHRPWEPTPRGDTSAVSQTPGAKCWTNTAVFPNSSVTYDVSGEATPT